MTRLACIGCAALVLLLPAVAAAQDHAVAPPAHISVVDGSAVLEREGQADAAPTSMPLLVGDRLRTQDGRVEVLFSDGAALHLDTSTTVDLQSNDVIRLVSGRVRLSIPQGQRETYRVDAPAGWVQMAEPGEYRVATRNDGPAEEIELAVLRGQAVLFNDDGQTALRAGERAFARRGAAPSYPYVYNSAAWDAFDRWSDARREERRGVSAQYLPETIRTYSATFDRDGDWQYETTYGYVWYPRVNVGWRPYYYGRWASLPSFGWTWIGSDRWAWPTHHYGRWGFSAGAWFWIPGVHWGPAWVSWAYAPGYVSWCPLGFNNRPVVQFAHVNVYGSRYNAWNAWTVVPHQRFGRGWVNHDVVAPVRLDAQVRSAFVVRDSSPSYRGAAVPRNAAPFYGPGPERGRVAALSSEPPRGASSARSGAAVAPRTAAPVSRPSADDSAAVFRSRRPPSEPIGPGYPAAARAPRDASVLTDPARTDAPAASRQRSLPARPQDVPVYRGGVLQRESTGVEDRSDTAPRRYDVPGYRRSDAPSSSVTIPVSPPPGTSGPAPRRAPGDESNGVVTVPRSTERPVMGGAAPPPVRVYRGTPTAPASAPGQMAPRSNPDAGAPSPVGPRSAPDSGPPGGRAPAAQRDGGQSPGATRGSAVPRSGNPPAQSSGSSGGSSSRGGGRGGR